ncbi:MAG: hypothetical protein IJH12_05030 [Clostridia bacterium]|nr:hypothetical protein [Clostridia bacterium]
MLTYDEIVKYIQENNIQNLIPYQGSNGIGIVYKVEIEDYGQKEPRLAIFDNISELARFVDQIKFADKVTTDKRDLVNSEPRFLLRGNVLTPHIVSAEKKKQKTLDAAKHKYHAYSSRRGQVLIQRIENIQKEISDLENTINSQTKKGTLLFKNSLKDENNQPLPSSEGYVLEELPIDSGSVSMSNFIKLKIQYEILKMQREMLQRKLLILRDFSHRSFLKKLVSSQKEIDAAFTEIDSQTNLTPAKSESDILEDERKLYELLHYFDDASFVQESPEFLLELLNFLKDIDSRSLNFSVESAINQELKVLKVIAKSAEDKALKLNTENTTLSKESKIENLLKCLSQQYNENLTNEQKDASLIYNSQLFWLIGEILNIPDYETMNNNEILDIIKLSPNFGTILKVLHSYCMMIQRRAYGQDEQYDYHLQNLMRFIFSEQTPQKLLSAIYISDVYSKVTISPEKEDLFSEVMYGIIEKMKKTIKTIKSIPEDAVVLPEDVIVYRGIDSKKLTNPQKPSNSVFMSISLNPQIASYFGGEQPAIYKIQLRKGTPVYIFPDKIFSSQDAFQHFIQSVDLCDERDSKELLINTDYMQEFEIKESIAPIVHYKFENGEFEETKSGFIITGEMEPKITQTIRDDIRDEEQIIA